MFPCSHGNIFWWDRSGKFKKQEGKNGVKKRRDFYLGGGSHTRVFSISRESPQATTLVQPSLRGTHSYGNLPYNINIVSLDEIRVLKPEFFIFWAKYSL
jgi:hypothetical protein